MSQGLREEVVTEYCKKKGTKRKLVVRRFVQDGNVADECGCPSLNTVVNAE